MPKYYVIPVDSDGLGYLGIKESYNPYDHRPWYCGGCPQAFGGNAQGGVFDTLYNEAMEESHSKIYLVRGVRYYRKVHEHDDMQFFVCTKFSYSPSNSIPQFLRKAQKKYWETTGEVLKFDLGEVPTADRASAAQRVLLTYYRRTGRRPTEKHMVEFMKSETAEAIRKAALLMQNGGLPTFV